MRDTTGPAQRGATPLSLTSVINQINCFLALASASPWHGANISATPQSDSDSMADTAEVNGTPPLKVLAAILWSVAHTNGLTRPTSHSLVARPNFLVRPPPHGHCSGTPQLSCVAATAGRPALGVPGSAENYNCTINTTHRFVSCSMPSGKGTEAGGYALHVELPGMYGQNHT